MYIFSLLLCIAIGIVMWVVVSKNDNKEEHEFHKRIPSKEEVLCVLRTVRAMYRCSPHEDECMEEAIKLIESMEDVDDDDE